MYLVLSDGIAARQFDFHIELRRACVRGSINVSQERFIRTSTDPGILLQQQQLPGGFQTVYFFVLAPVLDRLGEEDLDPVNPNFRQGRQLESYGYLLT